MPGRTATLTIQILGDAAKAQGMFGQTAREVGKVEGSLNSMAVPAPAALTGITLLGGVAVNEASKMEQAFGALEAVFGDQAAAADQLARNSAQSVGLASADYAQMAAVLGAQLRDMGVAEEDLIPTTEALIARGADMAAMYGGTTADAVSSISSLLRGERDPIEKYAVSIKEATVQAELAAQGLDGLSGEAKTAASTQATLGLLMDKSAVAAGTFARESDSAAGSQAIAEASWRNSAATLGQVLLPVVAAGAALMAEFAGFVEDNSTAVQIAVGIIGAFAAAILVANLALKAYRGVQLLVTAATKAHLVVSKAAQLATTAWTAVQWLLNAALTANPIGLVVVAIAALIGAFVLAYQKSETFRKIVDGVFRAVQKIVGSVVDFLVGLFETLTGAMREPFESLVGIVRSVFRTIRGIVEGAVEFISGLLDGIGDIIGGVVEALPGGQAAPIPPTTRGLLRTGAAGATSVPAGGLGKLAVHGNVTIHHRIDDPNGALERVPGGAAAIAAMLNRGAETAGLYQNLVHAGGIR